IVLFALAVTLLPPAAFLAAELLVDLVNGPAARVLHLVFVAGLSAVVVLHVLTKSDSLSGVTALVAAAGAGVAAAAVYLRARPFRSFLSILAPAPLVFVALFLLDSPVSKLVFADTPKVEAAKPVRNKLPIFSEYPHNLFTLLGKRYRLRVLEAITHLCPKSLCTDVPQANGQDVQDTTGSLASDAGIVYLHLLVPQPYATHLPP